MRSLCTLIASRNSLFPRSSWLRQACALVAVLVLASAARAQLSAPQLRSPAIEGFGPQNEDVEKAVIAFKKGDHELARKTLIAVRAKHPELSPADVMMAMLHLSAGEKAKAQAALERATISAPKDPEAYIILGDIALRSGQRAFADLAYQRGQALLAGLESNSRRAKQFKVRIEAGLASLCEARGQYEAAEKHLRAWTEIASDNPVPVGSLGRVQFHMKKYDEARDWFAKLTKMDKDAPPVEIAMGRLYSDAGMEDEALNSMMAAIKKDGKDIRIRLTVAEWALQGGRMELAQECVDAALKLDNDSLGGQVLAARIARQKGDLETAESILKAAVLRSPNQFALTNEFARTLAASEDLDKRKSGLEYARQNFRIHKNRATVAGRESAVTYAWLLLRNGKSAEAEAVLHTLPNKSSISSENAFYAAEIYLEREKRALAANALRATLSSNVNFPGKEKAEKLLAKLTGEGIEP